MVLHCIAWYCMVLHGIAWYGMVLHGIAWYCMVFFFYHIYLARVSRLMPKSFGFLCISPASTNRNVNKFTKCEHFTASNKCRAVSFNARSSLMFSLIWIGAA